jgi:ApbE superfamily uncharacterized protein (UPF0280 family)
MSTCAELPGGVLLRYTAFMSNEGSNIERAYRGVMEPAGLTCYEVAIGESDLYVCTRGDHADEARQSLTSHRSELESYLEKHLSFGTSFRPVPASGDAPEIVCEMIAAAEVFDVGPMASVAGAIAQYVGADLLEHCPEVIVENGGDIFLAGGGKRQVRIFAGASSPPVHVTVKDSANGVGLCTSSATVGPSISLGEADAVTVLAGTATTADAAASAIGNMVRSADDIEGALEKASGYSQILGVVIVVGGSIGAWGSLELG